METIDNSFLRECIVQYKEECSRVEGAFLTELLRVSYLDIIEFQQNITTKEEEQQDTIKKHIYLYNKYGFTILYRLEHTDDKCNFIVEAINESLNQ